MTLEQLFSLVCYQPKKHNKIKGETTDGKQKTGL